MVDYNSFAPYILQIRLDKARVVRLNYLLLVTQIAGNGVSPNSQVSDYLVGIPCPKECHLMIFFKGEEIYTRV